MTINLIFKVLKVILILLVVYSNFKVIKSKSSLNILIWGINISIISGILILDQGGGLYLIGYLLLIQSVVVSVIGLKRNSN